MMRNPGQFVRFRLNENTINDILYQMKKVLSDIKAKTFERVYLLTGDEPYLISFLSGKLKEALVGTDTMNCLEMDEETVSLAEAKAFTDTMPFFAERRAVFFSETGVIKSGSEDFAKWILTLPETAVVVFSESSADKRSQLYKAIEKGGYTAELNHPSEREKSDFILRRISKSGLQIRKSTFDAFVQSMPDDLSTVANETDKLISIALDKGEITMEDVETLVIPKLEERVFEMIDEASRGNRAGALKLYYDLIQLQEAVARIMAILIRKIVQIQQADALRKSGMNAKDAAKLIGIPDFAYTKLIRLAGSYQKSKLDTLLKDALELENRFKSGRLSDRNAVEFMIFKLSE